MALEVVIGNRLRDVSRAVIREIDISKGFDTENFIIVPDRFSLLAEEMIFDELSVDSTFNIQVIGISRLAKMILNETSSSCEVLTNDECKLIVFYILKKMRLNTFLSVSIALAEELFNIISQLKASGVSCDIFSKKVLDGEEFKDINVNREKLQDIAKLYNRYEEQLKDRGIDPSDLVSKLSFAIEESEIVRKSNFFFVEFDSLTEQGGIILEKLSLHSKRVVIGATRPFKQKNSHIYDNDILIKVEKIRKKNRIKVEKKYIEEGNLTPVQTHILNNLYAFSPEKKEGNLILLEFSTEEDEVRELAKLICFEVLHNGKRYSDFNVLTTNLGKKSDTIQRIFSCYNIPFYVDCGVKAEHTLPVQFINLIFKFILGRDSREKLEAFISLVKNPYSQIDFIESCKIENYLKKFGNLSLESFEQGFNGKEFLNKVNEVDRLSHQCRTGRNFVELVKEIILNFNIENTTENLIFEFQNKNEIKLEKIYQQVGKRIEDSLDVMENIVADEIEQFEKFVEIFESVLNQKEISAVPVSVDSVFIGDSVKSFFEERAILYVIGAEQNALPIILKDYSLLSDEDIEALAGDFTINPTIKMINKRNKFKLYQDLMLAREKIFISFSPSTSGDKAEPSSIVTELKKLFVRDGKEIPITYSFFKEAAIESVEENLYYFDIQSVQDYEREVINLINNYDLTIGGLKNLIKGKNLHCLNDKLLAYMDGKRDEEMCREIIRQFMQSQREEKIDDAVSILMPNNKVSASQLEKFFECPFKHFFTNGLKIKENEVCKFDARDIGHYFHFIVEKFVKDNAEKFGLMSEKEIAVQLETILKDLHSKERFNIVISQKDNKHIVAKLKKEAKMLLENVSYQQKWTDFVAKLFEEYFIMKLDDDINLTGYVDRVDISDNYFRVIDYKTGDVNLNLAEVYSGIKLQLFIYLIAMKEKLGLDVAGAFYFPIGDDFASSKGTRKKLMLTGFVLGEHAVLKRLDRRFSKTTLTSDIISLRLSSKSEDNNLICYASKNVLSPKGLDAILSYTRKLVKKAVEDIVSGKITATPMGKMPCNNCSLFGICSFTENDEARSLCKRLTEQDFVKIMSVTTPVAN
jgi:ATP-dependent helicase/nuclease subunit B